MADVLNSRNDDSRAMPDGFTLKLSGRVVEDRNSFGGMDSAPLLKAKVLRGVFVCRRGGEFDSKCIVEFSTIAELCKVPLLLE